MLQAYRAIFAHPHAALVWADMARFAGMYATNFRPGSPDETAFREGRRDFLTYIRKRAGLTDAEIDELTKGDEL